MWRARQAELRRSHIRQQVTINVPQKRRPKTFKEARAMMTPVERFAVFFLGLPILYFGFFAMLIFGFFGYCIVHDWIFGPPTDEEWTKAALSAWFGE